MPFAIPIAIKMRFRMHSRLWVVCCTLFCCLPAAAIEESPPYLVDSYGSPVMSSFGLCWRIGSWTSDRAIPCDSAAFLGNVIVPPHSVVEGKDISEWSMEFWKWLLAIPSDKSPAADSSNADCTMNQSGPVWFLAGRFKSGSSTRKCRIPYGRYIFFPMVTTASFRNIDEATNCQRSLDRVREMTMSAQNLQAAVDGAYLTNQAAHLEITKSCADIANVSAMRGRQVLYSVAATGHWVMLRPLSRGSHILNYAGGYQVDGFQSATRYELEIE